MDSRKEQQLAALNEWSRNTMMETLQIVFTDMGDDYLTATMPVDSKVHQPLGMLHGGASAALAESLGSCLSNIVIDRTKYAAVGTNLTCNHLKSKREGIVTGTARLLRKGKSLHYTEIEIRDEKNALICHATMSNMVITI